MPYSVLLIANNEYMRQAISAGFDDVRDEFNLCGYADNMVVAMSLIEELSPQIILSLQYMSFWNVSDLIERSEKRQALQYVLLCEESDRREDAFYKQSAISGVLPLSGLTSDMLLTALRRAGADWQNRTGRRALQEAALPVLSGTLWAGEHPQMSELLSGISQKSGSVQFRDPVHGLVSLEPDTKAYILLARPKIGHIGSLLTHIGSIPSFFTRFYQALDRYGGGYAAIRSEDELCIILPDSPSSAAAFWETLAEQINILMQSLNLPQLVFTLSEEPVRTDSWTACVRELSELHRYRFFTGGLVLQQGSLAEKRRTISHEEIQEALNCFITSADASSEVRLSAASEKLFSLVSESLSFNVLSFVWSQLLMQYGLFLQAYRLDLQRAELLPS